MEFGTKIKLWFLSAQDNITVIFVFIALLLFFCLLKHCEEMKPTYTEYTEKAEIINVVYEYSYTHNGYNDAVPKVNGVRYSLFYKIHGIKAECNIFVKHYDERINENIDLRDFDFLEIRCNPTNVFSARIFFK